MKNLWLQNFFMSVALVLSSPVWAGADWNKDRVCFGDEIYVAGIGECRVVAEYGADKVHVVDSESKVREVDLSCQKFLKHNRNVKFWEEESGKSSQEEAPRFRRGYFRYSEWQKSIRENGPDESLRDPILEEVLNQR